MSTSPLSRTWRPPGWRLHLLIAASLVLLGTVTALDIASGDTSLLSWIVVSGSVVMGPLGLWVRVVERTTIGPTGIREVSVGWKPRATVDLRWDDVAAIDVSGTVGVVPRSRMHVVLEDHTGRRHALHMVPGLDVEDVRSRRPAAGLRPSSEDGGSAHSRHDQP